MKSLKSIFIIEAPKLPLANIDTITLYNKYIL